jgi:hypothetical protein
LYAPFTEGLEFDVRFFVSANELLDRPDDRDNHLLLRDLAIVRAGGVFQPIDHCVGLVRTELCAYQPEEVRRALFLALALAGSGKRDGTFVVLLLVMFYRR